MDGRFSEPTAAGVDTVDRYLDSVRNEPDRLAAFLRETPKGPDLHTHLSGATATLLRFAVEDLLCIDVTSTWPARLRAPPVNAQPPTRPPTGASGTR